MLDNTEIIKRYADTVYRIAYSYVRNKPDADDIFQEVFLRLVKKKPDFENDEHCKAWLIRVTVNCSKKHLRFRSRKSEIIEDTFVFNDPAESILNSFLMELEPKYRAVIHLFYYEDRKTSEISDILGIKESTVRTQLTRARRILGDKLREADIDVKEYL